MATATQEMDGGHAFASPISGASVNLARTLSPDIAGHDYTGWWIYIPGPVIGAVRRPPDKDEREAAQGDVVPVFGTPKAPETKETP
jgi:aquaporin Z